MSDKAQVLGTPAQITATEQMASRIPYRVLYDFSGVEGGEVTVKSGQTVQSGVDKCSECLGLHGRVPV